MEAFMEEYGSAILGVISGTFLIGFAFYLVTQGDICKYILEYCLGAV